MTYLIFVSAISDSFENFGEVVANLTLEFEELQQSFMLTMQEANQISNDTDLTLRSINATQQEVMNLLQ